MKEMSLIFKKTMISFLCSVLCLLAITPNDVYAADTMNTEDTVTIIDDSDVGTGLNKINYSGGWSVGTGDANSHNGTYHYVKHNDTLGRNTETLSVQFTGNRIELYGPKRAWFGIYEIQIDNEAPTLVNAYSSTDLWSEKVYESGTLAAGEHTLKLTFKWDNQINTDDGKSREVNVDYFKVYQSKVEAESVNIKGGDFSIQIGEKKQLEAEILPIGAESQEIEWSVSDSSKAAISADGLLNVFSSGEIEVIAKVKGTAIEDRINAEIQSANNADFITVINDSQEGDDYFEVEYQGIWGKDENLPDRYHNGDSHWSNSKNFGNKWPSYTVDFIGTKIEVYGSKGKSNAIYDIKIDGNSVAKVNAYNDAERIYQQKLFESDILADGEHSLTVTLLDEKRPGNESANHEATFDYARVYHNAIPAERISVNTDDVLLEKGMTAQLLPSLFPKYTTVKDAAFTYTAANSNVATVDQTGTITAVDEGKTVITVGMKDSNIEAKVAVEVVKERGNLRAVVVDTDHHYYQDDYEKLKNKLNLKWHGSAWRNDEMLSEISLVTLGEKASDVEVTASDFVNENGAVLSSDNVTIDFLKETSAHIGHGKETNGGGAAKQPHKNVPDIIYRGGKMDIEANRVQNVWLNIAVPEEAESGTYEGVITVKSKEQGDIVLTYTFDVFNIVAPNPENYEKTLELWEYPFDVAKYYNIDEADLFGERHLDILRENLQLYKNSGGTVANGVILDCGWGQGNPMGATGSLIRYTKEEDGSMSYDYTYFDKWFSLNEELGIDDKFKLFSVSKEFADYYDKKTGSKKRIEFTKVGTDVWYAFWSEFLQDFIPHLVEKGWVDKTYFAVDEIPEDQIKHFLNLLEQNTVDGNKLKLSAAVNYSHMSEDTMMKIDDVSISLYYIGRDATTQHIIDRRNELGLDTTFYTCVGTFPNSFTLNNPADSAWTIWYNNALGFDGFLRWAYNCWVPTAYDNLDYVKYEAGDTMFIYPDEDRNAATPRTRSTPRFENMRQARRDVEKFNFLMAQSEELRVKGQTLLDSLGYTKGGYNAYGGVYAKNEEEAEYIVSETNRMRAGLVELSKLYVETRTVDKTQLQEVINQYSALNQDEYTEESWALFENSLASANEVMTYKDAVQEDVDKALQALEDAVSNLAYRDADYTALDTAISNAEAKLKADDITNYTDASVKALEAALKEAKAIARDLNITEQEQIDKHADKLNSAIEQLTNKPTEPSEPDDPDKPIDPSDPDKPLKPNKPLQPAYVNQIVNNAQGVTAIGKFPKSVQLIVENLADNTEILAKITNKDAVKKFKFEKIYDIYMLHNGKTYTPKGSFTVKIKLDDELSAKRYLGIVYISDDGEAEIIDSKVENGTISFTTNHNSYYAIVSADSPIVNTATQSHTPSNAFIFILLGAVLILAVKKPEKVLKD